MTESNLLQVRVQHKQSVATDIISLTLVRPDHSPLPPFEAGSHIDLHLPNGLVRQYSLCNAPHDHSHYQLGVLLEPRSRGGSACVHSDLQEGTELFISRPRNLFPLVSGSHHVLVAGGIGITPILCMAEQLRSNGDSFELHYCARSRDRIAFAERLLGDAMARHVTLYVDEDPASAALNPDPLLRCPAGKQLYVCGPAGFISFISDTARTMGWHNNQIHSEQFSAQPPDPGSEAGSFEIQIASSGQLITVASDQTAAAAMKAAGVAVELSCEQGICGSCLTPILDGQPDHRDLFQSEEEKASNRQFTPCCSRASSRRLVLDL